MRFRLLAAVLLFAAMPVAAFAADVTVFGAASLSDASNEIAKAYQQQSGKTVAVSLAASSALAKQIEASGGADVFISADEDWITISTRRASSPMPAARTCGQPAGADRGRRCCRHRRYRAAFRSGRRAEGREAFRGRPGSVPAGKYGKEALTRLGVWDSVSANLARAENVRVALAYVARGEAPLGIVYETDAKAEPKVKVAGVFPEDSHAPILYPEALTKGRQAGRRRVPGLSVLSRRPRGVRQGRFHRQIAPPGNSLH